MCTDGIIDYRWCVGRPKLDKVDISGMNFREEDVANMNLPTAGENTLDNLPMSSTANHKTSGNRIDFPALACKICGDRSSGVHYGIISCEGCKGFFRRCLRRQKDYICVHGGKCEVSRQQRNRCPACRYKKCIELGMSKQAVRIGRIPNKQKETEFVDIEPFTQDSLEGTDHNVNDKVDPEMISLTKHVVQAHSITAKEYAEFDDFLKGKCMKKYHAEDCEAVKSQMSDLNDMNGLEMWCSVVTETLSLFIKRIVTFCKCIPGFASLDQQDQMVLIKAGLFEILTIQDSIELVLYNAFMLSKELLITRPNMLKFMPKEMVDSLYDFAHRLHRLQLTMTEIALLSAIVLYADDREDLQDRNAIAAMQAKLLMALKLEVQRNHRSDPHMFAKILLRLPELRTVDSLHIQFIMKLQIGINGSEELQIPALYKEVYELGLLQCSNQVEEPCTSKRKRIASITEENQGDLDCKEATTQNHWKLKKEQMELEQIALVGLSGRAAVKEHGWQMC